MAGGVRGAAATTLNLPHLTRRELLGHRAKLARAIGRGRNIEAGTALLARIEAELEARRTLRFDNAARDVPPLYPGMRDEDV
jgi:hypothetical protein